jgi:hypothetical protein
MVAAVGDLDADRAPEGMARVFAVKREAERPLFRVVLTLRASLAPGE